jgi:DNA repair exonuclease SbcCD ATPase subunit
MGTSQIFEFVTPGLVSALLFFLHRFIKKFDEVTDRFAGLTSEVTLLKERLSTLDRLSDKLQSVQDQFSQMKADLQTALLAASKVKELEAEITIIKRDQATMWRKIDECKG